MDNNGLELKEPLWFISLLICESKKFACRCMFFYVTLMTCWGSFCILMKIIGAMYQKRGRTKQYAPGQGLPPLFHIYAKFMSNLLFLSRWTMSFFWLFPGLLECHSFPHKHSPITSLSHFYVFTFNFLMEYILRVVALAELYPSGSREGQHSILGISKLGQGHFLKIWRAGMDWCWQY